MNFLGFGQSAEIDIVFDGAETRKTVEVKGEDGKMEKLFLYYDGETVSGKVNVTLKKPGSKLEHQGIKIEFIGQIELFYDRGNHHEFKGIVKALARPGDLLQNTSYPFEFPNVEKSFETYAGSNVRLRYFLRATIVRRISDITREVDIAVHTLCSYPDLNNPIKMEVGIEDCLHIEFEYNKSKYHLKDVIVGKIYFLLVRIKIKHMEIAIIKRESTGSGPNMFTENETIAKYEIMDGAPVKGESIPIRVFLAGYSLTPTMRDINKKFSVKYFLNLVLMDTEDRRYFKQQEITLWRKADKTRKSQNLHSTNHPNAPTHLVGSNSNIGHDNDLQSRYGIVGSMKNSSSSTMHHHQNIEVEDSNANIDENCSDDEIQRSSGGGGSGETESTMGLFIRESPQQEYAQHEDSPTTISSTSLRSTINIPGGGVGIGIDIGDGSSVNGSGRPSAEILRGTADGAASNSAQNDGGGATSPLSLTCVNTSRQITIGDKTPSPPPPPPSLSLSAKGIVTSATKTTTATVTSTTTNTNMPSSTSQFIFETPNAVMVSTTPPPLPISGDSGDSGLIKSSIDDISRSQKYQTSLTANSNRATSSELSNVPSLSSSPNVSNKKTKNDDDNDDISEEEMINVPLNVSDFTSTTIIKRKSHANDDDDDENGSDG